MLLSFNHCYYLVVVIFLLELLFIYYLAFLNISQIYFNPYNCFSSISDLKHSRLIYNWYSSIMIFLIPTGCSLLIKSPSELNIYSNFSLFNYLMLFSLSLQIQLLTLSMIYLIYFTANGLLNRTLTFSTIQTQRVLISSGSSLEFN